MPRGLRSCTSRNLVSAARNGSRQVLVNYFEAEKERVRETRHPDVAIKSTVRALLGLKNKSKHLFLNDTLILAKNVAQNPTSKSIRKICKAYVNLEKEKIYLYSTDVNEATKRALITIKQ